MDARIVLATRGITDSTNGLITFKIQCSRYLWMELLTHRRASRNASSHRAMSTKRTLDLDNYIPAVFYKTASGMQSSDEPIRHQRIAKFICRLHWKLSAMAATMLEKLDVSKEQRNRLLPTSANIIGLVTMTEDGWKHFLTLRYSPTADKAMQLLAIYIATEIERLKLSPDLWLYSDQHIPFDPGIQYDFDTRCLIAAARIARISYNAHPKGKKDLELAKQLLKDKHLSPFEHICVFTYKPELSALFCKKEDAYIKGVAYPVQKYGWMAGWGWQTYRSIKENT